MTRIQYNPAAIRRVASECKGEADSVDLTHSDMMDQIAENEGKMRKKMEQNIFAVRDCAQNTQDLLFEAANFMAQLATYLEQQDEEIAYKMGE